MQLLEQGDSLLLCDAAHFDARTLFDSGQNFRFLPNATDPALWRGVAGGRPLSLRPEGPDAWRLFPCTRADFDAYWRGFFDLDRDYAAVAADLRRRDPSIGPALAYCQGLRILRQDPFETLVCFILSANNNMTRIRRSVQAMCSRFGAPIEAPWGTVRAFPTPRALRYASQAALRDCGVGYRDRYIKEAARMVHAAEIDLEALRALPTAEARAVLMRVPGVGTKVADCILLFALDKREAFPADTWVKRIAREVYDHTPCKTLAERFGPEAGYAQQVLFHYHRSRTKAHET
nr:DNA glycosylase [Maliibacterium massiliense]